MPPKKANFFISTISLFQLPIPVVCRTLLCAHSSSVLAALRSTRRTWRLARHVFFTSTVVPRNHRLYFTFSTGHLVFLFFFYRSCRNEQAGKTCGHCLLIFQDFRYSMAKWRQWNVYFDLIISRASKVFDYLSAFTLYSALFLICAFHVQAVQVKLFLCFTAVCCMSQKTEKPTLSGQRIKTRKRGKAFVPFFP